MSNAPLMPKATAVWLVDNTALTFDQVADFTKMHPLEVRAIADGDAAQGIKGMDPISNGQLTREEIEKGERNPDYRLKLQESKVTLPQLVRKESDGRKLYAAKIPRKEVPGLQQRLMKEQDHIREQGEVDPQEGALMVHGEPLTVSHFPTC